MSNPYLLLRNKAQGALTVLVEGKPVSIAPFGDLAMDEITARLFLSRYPTQVEVIDMEAQVGTYQSADFAPATMWIANATGNPDAPESITLQELDRKTEKYLPVTRVNPFKDPKVFKDTMHGAELLISEGGYNNSVYGPAQHVEIEPYKSIEVPTAFGTWLLRRYNNSRVENWTYIIKSRPLPDWRPTGAWKLDDLRMYLRMCKPNATSAMLGESEKEIKSKLGASVNKDKVFATRVMQAKAELIKRIFFCLADPSVRLPTREDFELETKTPELAILQKEAAAAEAVLAKAT